MTAAIKAMLAEKVMLAVPPAREEPIDPTFAILDRAKEFVDDNYDGEGVRPSLRLMILYCVMSTGAHPEAGDRWVWQQLSRARQRYRDGYFANPFGEPVLRDAAR